MCRRQRADDGAAAPDEGGDSRREQPADGAAAPDESGLCMCRRQRAAIVAERARAVPPFSRYCFRIAQRKLGRIDESSG